MKRCFDLFLAIILIATLFLVMIFVALLILVTSKGPLIYWSDRVGINNRIFRMPKFRSMKIDTPEVATHLLSNPEGFRSPIGGFLRRSSLDELPQLFTILKGDMTFVGPRPALYNQDDLIDLRVFYGLDKIKPGLTGWAQVNGRDELTINEKVTLEVEYLQKQTFWFDLKILWMTFLKVFKNPSVSH